MDTEQEAATESREEWAARNAAYAAAHPVPPPSRILGPALATPAVLMLLILGGLLVELDAELGGASSQQHQDLLARYLLALFAGLGCLTAAWLTPRASRAAWLRTAFAVTSVVSIPAAILSGG
ncbi:hypothetical protein [Streptomyces luteocolor]|uniref:hypothetical protein n=1 Tax=Streptomyces luteocolor TaxID=285500 RepID=UPI0008535732|nr:hypothetical protein [Streptomyces luteocolor]MCF3125533.1 hypothetical protein [Streptomyces arenae]